MKKPTKKEMRQILGLIKYYEKIIIDICLEFDWKYRPNKEAYSLLKIS